MKHVVFVAPFFGSTMMKCLLALTELEDVKVGVITHEPEEHVPPALRRALAGHFRVKDALDADQLALATHAFQREWGRVDRLLGYLEQLQLPLAQARDAVGVEGMDTATARRFRDKNVMKQAMAEAGLPVARQALIHGAEDARRFVAAVGYPIVLKPTDGLGTKDTLRAGDEGELYKALNRLMPSPKRPVQAEQFVTGAEHTFESVSIDGEVVWSSSTYYLPGPLQVLENPWMQYCVLLPREEDPPHVEAFRPLNHAALRSLGMRTGMSHMEWFLPKGGSPVISEVAARPPGVNIMAMNGLAAEVDFWAKWARLMVHKEWEMPARRWACGCAFLRGQGRGRAVVAIEGLEETLSQLGGLVASASLPKVGQPRSSHYEGEGWVLVRDETTQGVVEALRKVITQVKLHYR
ncbi:MAG: acetyl-CoA carboxylase biotin carboxylase subunit family protein [Planctomycetota bacterium]